MNNQDLNRFKSIMAALGDYYEKPINSTVVSLYWQDFKEYSIDVFEKAVSDHRKDPDQGMFFPKTAHLMRQINGNAKDKQNQLEAKAQRIWSELINHLSRRGHRVPFHVEDGAALDAFKAMGGMNQLNMIETKQIEWEGKKFTKLYLDNLASDRSFESGTLGIAPPESQNLLESHENKDFTPVHPDDARRMFREIASILNSDEKKPTRQDEEELKAKVIKRAKDHMKKKGDEGEPA